MRPILLTAVLLLVTVVHGDFFDDLCAKMGPCGDGWTEVHESYCVKTFMTPKGFFRSAQHCRSMNAVPLPIKGFWRLRLISCLSGIKSADLPPVWVGAFKNREGKFRFVDGYYFTAAQWRTLKMDRYEGQDACIMYDYKVSTWMTARCSEPHIYACLKRK